MDGRNQQNPRLVKFINQLMDTLKEDRNNVDTAVDEYINQVKREVDGFVSGSHGKQATYEEISNRLQQAINFFIAISGELSGLISIKYESHESTSSAPHTPQSHGSSTGVVISSSFSKSMTVGGATVEETLLSLKRTMEQLEEKQEYFDKTLKGLTNQEENFNKEIEILTNANSRCQKKLKERLIAFEKTSLESSATVDKLYTVFSVNVDARVNRLEEENKSVNASMNEFNKHISSLRSCSNDVIRSTHDLSKRVESTDQHYNEVSDKLNQLEISLNLLSSEYKEQFEHVCSVYKEKIDDCIGTICQLLAKRLGPLEKLNDTLNKKLNSSKKLSQVDDVEIRMAKLAGVVKEIELKCSYPNVGFYAQVLSEVTGTCRVVKFKDPPKSKYGDYFDPSAGTFIAPLKGFYLISLNTPAADEDERFCVTCNLRGATQEDDDEGDVICFLNRNQSVTRCIELEAGDKLYLQARTIERSVNIILWINFACCMIKG